MSLSPRVQGDLDRPRTGTHGRRLLSVAGLALLVVAVVGFMYRPTVSSVVQTLPWNLGDPALNTWILSWETHALVRDPSSFFDGNIFHPYGDAIKYSELILPVVPVFGLALALTSNPIAAHNVAILFLAGFCLVTTYLLAMRLTGPLVAAVAAVSFSFSGYVFMHQGHLQLLTLGFIPLAFLVLFRALHSRRLRDGVWLGICTALLTTGSLYYGAIWLVILVALVLIDWIRLRRPDRQWWSTMGVAAGVSALLVGPIAYVYAAFQRQVPFVREVGGLGLNPIDFLTPAPGSLLYGGLFEWASARQPSGIVEHGFFIGFVIMTLSLIGAVAYTRSVAESRRRAEAGRGSYEMGMLAFAGVVSLVLAVGPEVKGIPMPFRLFSEYVPGFEGIRAASRLAVPALLAAAVFAAWGLQRLSAALSREQRLLVVSLIVSAVLLEMWVQPLRVEVDPRSSVRTVLAAAPPGAVIELPMRTIGDADFAFIEGPRLLESIGDWRPRFNGFSGGFPPGYIESIPILMMFPAQEAIALLEELDIRYVVLHGADEGAPSSYTPSELDEILRSLPAWADASGTGESWVVELSSE